MNPTLENLCAIIRKYEIDYKRASEMTPEERAIVDWACDQTEKESIYLNRDCVCEGDLIVDKS